MIGNADNDNGRQLDFTLDEVASFMPVGGTNDSDDENDFIIQIFSQLSTDLCMQAKGKKNRSSVKLRGSQHCTSFRIDDDDGLIRTSDDYCLETGNDNSLGDGSKMRFYDLCVMSRGSRPCRVGQPHYIQRMRQAPSP